MNIFTPKVALFDSHIERAQYLMVYRLSLVFIFIFTCLIFLFQDTEINSFIGYIAALIVSVSALIYLLVRKTYTYIYIFYAISGSIIAQFSCNFSMTTTHYSDFLMMLICALLAFVGSGKKWGIMVLVINIIGIFYFIFFQLNNHIVVIKPLTPSQTTAAFVELILAFFAFGYLMFQFISFQNFSDSKLRRANVELAEQNVLIRAKSQENISLVKEIHHRVKNNLQIIISLLRLQRSEIQGQDTKEQFTEAINRVMVMSSIHQRLYQEKEVARINLKSYLTDLATDLKAIFEMNKPVTVDVETTYSDIDLKTVVPLGLLLNELISNSYKYAFKTKSSGQIKILITEKADQFELDYSDNGKWQEKQNSNSGFGLDLITILAEQLNGTYGFETDDAGTRYHFTLSKLG